MAYTSLQLITSSYYLSGVVSQIFETVEAEQVSIGFTILNDLLDEKVADEGMIPYTSKGTFNGVIGQEVYSIENLISIDTLTFFKDSVRYSLTSIPRDKYFGSPRVENINTLPYSYHLERNFGGATIYVFFPPDEAYNFEWWGKSRLNNVTLAQDLSLTLDGFYRNYLKYLLAQRICDENSSPVPPRVEAQLIKFHRMIDSKLSPMDLSMQKVSTLSRDYYPDPYQYANLGNGWLP